MTILTGYKACILADLTADHRAARLAGHGDPIRAIRAPGRDHARDPYPFHRPDTAAPKRDYMQHNERLAMLSAIRKECAALAGELAPGRDPYNSIDVSRR